MTADSGLSKSRKNRRRDSKMKDQMVEIPCKIGPGIPRPPSICGFGIDPFADSPPDSLSGLVQLLERLLVLRACPVFLPTGGLLGDLGLTGRGSRGRRGRHRWRTVRLTASGEQAPQGSGGHQRGHDRARLGSHESVSPHWIQDSRSRDFMGPFRRIFLDRGPTVGCMMYPESL